MSFLIVVIGNGSTGDICPVLESPVSDVHIQPQFVIQPDTRGPHFNGRFFTSQNLDATLFNVSHINHSCVGAPSEMCDQLLVTKIAPIHSKGNFSIQYDPVGEGQCIGGTIEYGT